ncbi:MAG TPA: hypothetical protein VHM90_07760 [Phycisphaerae bacterium]|nr:hypothetical protein [Phycisphaerae bacterium]
MKFHLALASLAVLLPALRASAAFNTYVSHSGTINLFAITDGNNVLTTPAGINYNSGQLLQNSVSGGTNTGVAGTLSFNGPHIQSADGSITDSVSIGYLHALVKANATTNNYPYGTYSNATSTADVFSNTAWFDTVTFFTGPSGADFTATIYLHDEIDNSAAAQSGSTYSIGSVATLSLTVSGTNPPLSSPTLGITDSEYLHSDGPIANPPDAIQKSVTFHVTNGQTLTFLETLNIRSTALGGNTSTVADAYNTAGFVLASSDPSAFYTSASGTTFPTSVPVPEPASLLLILPALTLLARRNRRA